MWEGCEFNLTMEFSSDYPATAPVVKFVSRPGEVESCVGINAIEQTQLRRRYRVDGVGRPKFDFHTDLHSASVFHGAVRPPSGLRPA